MNEKDYEMLYESKKNELQVYVRRHVDPAVQEELVQEVFSILWGKRDTVAMDDHIMMWVYKTIKNLAANYRRRAERKIEFADYVEIEKCAKMEPEYGMIECRMLLEEYMSAEDGEAFLEHYAYGTPLSCIAKRKNVSENALRGRLNRYKKKIESDVAKHKNQDIYKDRRS